VQGEFSYHGGPAQTAPIPACAAATLLYAYRIIKPAAHALSTVERLWITAAINRDAALRNCEAAPEINRSDGRFCSEDFVMAGLVPAIHVFLVAPE
jgi:hypothetical protein